MEKLKVLIMPGHYANSPGALSDPSISITEYETVYTISENAYLRLQGNEHIEPMLFFDSDLKGKKEHIDSEKPDIIIENHMNWSRFKNTNGVLTVFEEGNAESKILATEVNDTLAKLLLMKNYGIFSHKEIKGWRKWKNFFIFDRIEYNSDVMMYDVPTILTEIGYLSNVRLATSIMKSSDFVDRAGLAIAKAIDKYAKQFFELKNTNFIF